MGGTSKGRVAKKQRQPRSSRTPTPSTQPTARMRRGVGRYARTGPPARHHLNLSAIDDMFNQFRESDGAF